MSALRRDLYGRTDSGVYQMTAGRVDEPASEHVRFPGGSMPLNDGYGVLIGTIQNYFRDPPDDFGRYYHGNLEVLAPAGVYRCAIDVDSHQSNTGVEWRVMRLRGADLAAIPGLAQGFHPLASNSTSGALDYVRSPFFTVRVGCLLALLQIFRKAAGIADTWKRGTSVEALSDLEPLVAQTRTAGLRAFVFGEPFRTGRGVHNIHQNQGDPVSSPWSAENGIWQDGCTILEQGPDDYAAFMNKFTTQSYQTDANGHPA